MLMFPHVTCMYWWLYCTCTYNYFNHCWMPSFHKTPAPS